MKKPLPTVVATALSVLFASSSAFAFCLGEKDFVVTGILSQFGLGKDNVQCRDGDIFASMDVTRFDSRSYLYLVGGDGPTSEVGGVLLDDTGSVVIGDRGGAAGRGPCNQSTFGVSGLFVSQFACNNADAEVAIIRVFAD